MVWFHVTIDSSSGITHMGMNGFMSFPSRKVPADVCVLHLINECVQGQDLVVWYLLICIILVY